MAKKKLAIEADGVVHYGPQVKAGTDEYNQVNLKGDPFERHQWDGPRMLNGHYNVRVCNRGRWHHYFKISHPSARRVNCLQRTYGNQVAFDQWEMPDRCLPENDRSTAKIDTDKQIADLGFWQYVKADIPVEADHE